MDPETVNVLRDYVHELMKYVSPAAFVCAAVAHPSRFPALHQLHGPRSRSNISTRVRDSKFIIPTFIANVTVCLSCRIIGVCLVFTCQPFFCCFFFCSRTRKITVVFVCRAGLPIELEG